MEANKQDVTAVNLNNSTFDMNKTGYDQDEQHKLFGVNAIATGKVSDVSKITPKNVID
jgi:hypothetical protein